MTIGDLYTVLSALPWREQRAREIVVRAIEAYEARDPYHLTQEALDDN